MTNCRCSTKRSLSNRCLESERITMAKRINIISLGCSKNLVDTERLMKMLESQGFEVDFEAGGEKLSSANYDAVIINTCGFIGDAKEESINTILEWTERKVQGAVKKIYVFGCLSERYGKELEESIPEVDFWRGKINWPDIVRELTMHDAEESFQRRLTTPGHHAYLKIAEGCNRFCAFCAIPLITGRYKSRTIEDIVAEVKYLVRKGVKEFNVIAQDLSNYGADIYGEQKLAELIDRIADVDGVQWIRLHYLYPHDFPMDLLDVMAKRNNVCKYMDIALQHCSDKVLENMRRHINKEQTKELLRQIREKVPGIHIRTTLMTGFPGEGEREFEELKQFVKEQRFERMGAFAYCEEEDTYAAKNFTDSISQEVKQSRLDEIMAIQENISDEIQQGKVGRVMKVIIDSESDDYFVGRTEYDSPEVDPEVLIKKNDKIKIGEFYNVRITAAYPFELVGEAE